MSAFMGIVMPDRIEVLTDGACYDEEGVLLATRRKAVTLDAFPAVITGRGRGRVLRIVTEAAQRVFSASTSFDEGLDMLEGALSQSAGKAEPFDMLIAGASEAHGLSLFCFRNRHDPHELEPFIFHQISTATICGVTVPQQHYERVVESGGFRKTGVQLMNNLRTIKGNTPAEYTNSGNDRADYFVGGHCDLTTIKGGKVKTERLHTWDDKLGSKIEPNAEGNVVPIDTSGMSRQQRRAALRETRRRA